MSGCNAEYVSVWKTWPQTATKMLSDASGKLCTNNLKKKCQHTTGNDGSIYVLDHPCSGIRSKQLPNDFPKFLSSQSHYMSDTASMANRRTTSRFGRWSRCLRYRPVEGDVAILRNGQEISTEKRNLTYFVLNVDVWVLSQAMVDLFATYDANQHHSSIPSRHVAMPPTF